MTIVICPGIHDPALTQQFVQGLLEAADQTDLRPEALLVFPAEQYPAYSGLHILRFLHQQCCRSNPDLARSTPIVFIGFSAGVVGAVSAASAWQTLGGTVKALLAIDGWGVPLVGNFPMHRLSHDPFTHWSAALLGAGKDSFYADPGVEHLEFWRSPQAADGWWLAPDRSQPPVAISAASFVTALLRRYGELR
ncbi:hypothetical protein [Stenomitos frigidus]|uniref:Alpha/beta hydrolase n=1 Tax=Stenomitos frigidus ULC18 TaxID=2107698 RepID=A0A2T1ESI3_9CYAN|nr:hypothetical protein [Stenomitos frigidus]PSB35712.1 hypothetical protein C7B82_00375 [Stenomitos frigidus ULC18]